MVCDHKGGISVVKMWSTIVLAFLSRALRIQAQKFYSHASLES